MNIENLQEIKDQYTIFHIKIAFFSLFFLVYMNMLKLTIILNF